MAAKTCKHVKESRNIIPRAKNSNVTPLEIPPGRLFMKNIGLHKMMLAKRWKVNEVKKKKRSARAG